MPILRYALAGGACAGIGLGAYFYIKKPVLNSALLAKSDAVTTSAICDAFKDNAKFIALSKAEMTAILARDAEDGDKLADGVQLAVDKGVLSKNPPVEPTTVIDVLGKTPKTVTREIMGKLPSSGCIMVLQGLSGTGKGTTVDCLKQQLPNAVTWSNGNVFRSLTLLAVTHCEQQGIPFSEKVLTPELLQQCAGCLTFDKYNGQFDTRIKGFGLDLLVSEVQNTTLKDPKVGKNIPTVAKWTQGEVVLFAGGAAEKMRADGMNVLVEGREQTLNHLRTPYRFELTLSDPTLIGSRRAAQRMMGEAQKALKGVAGPTPEAIHAELEKALDNMA